MKCCLIYTWKLPEAIRNLLMKEGYIFKDSLRRYDIGDQFKKLQDYELENFLDDSMKESKDHHEWLDSYFRSLNLESDIIILQTL